MLDFREQRFERPLFPLVFVHVVEQFLNDLPGMDRHRPESFDFQTSGDVRECHRSTQSAPVARATASIERTMSPAPVTSYTCRDGS